MSGFFCHKVLKQLGPTRVIDENIAPIRNGKRLKK